MVFDSNSFLKLTITLFALGLIIGPVGYELIILICSFFFIFNFRKILNFDKIIIFFLIYYFYILTLSFFSSDIRLSLESSLFFIRFIFFAIIVSYFFSNFNKLNKFFVLSTVTIFVFVIFDSFFQFFIGFNLFGLSMDKIDGVGRISGVFGKEYILGSYLSRLFPLLIGILIYNFSHIKYFNNYLVILIILINITIFISGERSALLYCLVFNLLILFLHRKKFKIFLTSIIISTLITYIIILISPLHKERIINKTINQISNFDPDIKQEVKDSSEISENFSLVNNLKIFSYEHQNHYMKALEIFKKNVLFGVGPKLFRKECKNKIYTTNERENIKKGCSTHPHNIYIQSLAETGLIGFIFLFSFLCFIIVKIFKQLIYQDKHYIFSYVYISIFISLFPLIPTGSLFNSWLLSINFFIYGYYLYIKNSRDFF